MGSQGIGKPMGYFLYLPEVSKGYPQYNNLFL